MKPTNIILAKITLDRFYRAAFENAKQAKELRNKVNKLEDTSYLHDALDENAKRRLTKEFAEHREEELKAIEAMEKSLHELHKSQFDKDKAMDFVAAKKEIKGIEKKCQEASYLARTVDATALYDLPTSLQTRVKWYQAQISGDEYVDPATFYKEIDALFEAAMNVLSSMKEALKAAEPEYLSQYCAFADDCSRRIYEQNGTGPKRLPDWAKGLFFCLPWIIGFLIFTLYPLIQTLIFSFSTVNLTPDGFSSSWNGFTNYINIFTNDTDFLLALKNYLISIVIYVPLITILSLMLAMLLNTNIRGRGFFRVIFFFPVIITSGPVMKILIEQGVTAMPGLSNLFNLEEITASMPDFLRTAINIMTSEFVMILWFSGIQILVFLTALQKIDKSVYEASAIDGANRWEQFWKVTLPAINSSIVINVVFTTVMQSIFALNPIILKIQADMNDTAEGKGYGYSSALAFTYFLIMIVVLAIFVLIFKRHNGRRKQR